VVFNEASVKFHKKLVREFYFFRKCNVFKNAMVYRLVSPWTTSRSALEKALESHRFNECGASQEKSVGWIEPRGQAHGDLVEVVGGQWVLKLAIEVKTVPGSVIKRKVLSQVEQIEETTGRKPGKKEQRTLADDARLSLLPMAFSKQSTVTVWMSPKDQWMVLDAGSQAKADEVLTCLVKAIEGFAVTLIHTQASPAASMAHWLGSKEAPPGFSVDRECELKAADESKAVVRYTRHPLDTDEVSQHIAAGKVPTRLALTWNDRISFVLTEALTLKKMAFLDVVLEDAPMTAGDRADDHFDADVSIATGELSRMLPALIEALGGEVAIGQLPVPLAA